MIYDEHELPTDEALEALEGNKAIQRDINMLNELWD